jgi:hypothetical protein
MPLAILVWPNGKGVVKLGRNASAAVQARLISNVSYTYRIQVGYRVEYTRTGANMYPCILLVGSTQACL